ncbi:hypothetical protein MTR_5g033840 [Medicago truncatula]|uniref:Transmembrane protein n=1 Tax=Medicago truncatula TaxID=3880 RepID=G7K070_MEDTR|nr:hypothetical protein MTR_5g033840 [Medicago truncatula]
MFDFRFLFFLLYLGLNKGDDLKQTKGLAAADLVLPQPVLLCLKFSSDGEKRKFAVFGVLGTITSFTLDDH